MVYATKYHYNANKEAYKKKARLRTLSLRKEVADFKESKPCADCGNYYPAIVMDFDHAENNKTSEVAKLISRGNRKTIFDEIAKCEVVCSNCHRLRTFNRMQKL